MINGATYERVTLSDLLGKEIVNGCCETTVSRRHAGYGLVSVKGEYRLAHEHMYEQFVRPIDYETEYLQQICNNKLCVRVDHLCIKKKDTSLLTRIIKLFKRK